MTLEKTKKIGMLGVGGSGMRSLAYLLSEKKEIIGTDLRFDTIKTLAGLEDIELVEEERMKDMLDVCDLIIYSDALVKSHYLLKRAVDKGIEVIPYQVALGQLTEGYTTIAITGTHGKSSTSAMLAHILVEAGLDPTVLIGAGLVGWGGLGAKRGKSKLFLVEADEYRDHYLELTPEYIGIVNIDFDHLDYFETKDQVVKSYQNFINKAGSDGEIVASCKVHSEYPQISWPKKTTLVCDNDEKVVLSLPGKHMQDNARLAIGIASKLGISSNNAKKHLKSFAGLSRRFEKLGQFNGVDVVSDYGHHPTEIEATIDAARSIGYEKILVVIEPHTGRRLTSFYNEFIVSLREVEGILVCPVYKARDEEDGLKTSEDFCRDLKKTEINTRELVDYDNLEGAIRNLPGDYDLILCFTAGILDFYLRKIVTSS